MPAEARTSSIWKKQKLFIAIFLLAIGAYFFWDGSYTWPRSNERWLKHEEFKKAENLSGWRDYAKNRGWTDEVPHKFYKSSDLVGQFVFGGLLTLLGGIVLVYWLTQRGRVLRSDDAAVYTPAGTRVPFDAISGLGKKNWDAKGLATVRYQLDGRQRQFVIDDYKFDADPARKILAEIEERLKGRQTMES